MIISVNELSDIRKSISEKIILATGTFDMFHYEHLEYLRQAKEQGEILVVAVKSDKCAKLKDPIRPIISEDQRIAIVESIRYVDYAFIVDYDETLEPNLPYENEIQRQWLVMFEKVFSSLKPDALYHENNPKLQQAREQVFSEYDVQGIVKERGKSISTSRIIKKLALLLQ